jgi:hypothetical protein
MDYIKPDPDGELYLTSSQNENQQIDVKEEEDPLLIKLPVASSENEVSCHSVCLLIITDYSEVCLAV